MQARQFVVLAFSAEESASSAISLELSGPPTTYLEETSQIVSIHIGNANAQERRILGVPVRFEWYPIEDHISNHCESGYVRVILEICTIKPECQAVFSETQGPWITMCAFHMPTRLKFSIN